MKRLTITALLVIAGVSAAYAVLSPAYPFLASLFFPNDLTEQDVLNRFESGGKVKLLIVPGHDNEFYGTKFNGMKEANLTLAIGKYLFDYLKTNSRLDVRIARDDSGYAADLTRYFEENKNDIRAFIDKARGFFNQLVSNDLIQKSAPPFQRSRANSTTVLRLYGINKWANENGIDIVLHLHLNNSDLRRNGERYAGFSIYVPEEQMPNYALSKAIAERLKTVFSRHWPASSLDLEKETVIEDPDLIALGAYGSLRSASVLIEYGYIYEPRFQFDLFLKEAAFQTHQGLIDYLERRNGAVFNDYGWIFPYSLTSSPAFKDKGSEAAAALQVALKKTGFYPPAGKTPYECPVSGTFQICTLKALSAFQNRYNIYGELGALGPKTRERMRAMGMIK